MYIRVRKSHEAGEALTAASRVILQTDSSRILQGQKTGAWLLVAPSDVNRT